LAFSNLSAGGEAGNDDCRRLRGGRRRSATAGERERFGVGVGATRVALLRACLPQVFCRLLAACLLRTGRGKRLARRRRRVDRWLYPAPSRF
jgi:hypothetical protein